MVLAWCEARGLGESAVIAGSPVTSNQALAGKTLDSHKPWYAPIAGAVLVTVDDRPLDWRASMAVPESLGAHFCVFE